MKSSTRTWIIRAAIAGGFTSFLVLEAWLGGDLWVGARIWDPDLGWNVSYHLPWSVLNDQGERATFVLIGVGALILARRVQGGDTQHRRSLLAILAVLILGPGVMVKALRDFWGRPRPRDVIELGGSAPYQPWWRPAGSGGGKSFPSGHTSLAASLLVFTVIPGVREKTRLRCTVMAVALGYTALVGTARLLRGAHFTSDVIWAVFLVWLAVLIVERTILTASPSPGETLPS